MKDLTQVLDVNAMVEWLEGEGYTVEKSTGIDDLAIIDEDGEEMAETVKGLVASADKLIQEQGMDVNIEDIEDLKVGDSFETEYTYSRSAHQADPDLELVLEVAPWARKTQTFGNGRGYYIDLKVVEHKE